MKKAVGVAACVAMLLVAAHRLAGAEDVLLQRRVEALEKQVLELEKQVSELRQAVVVSAGKLEIVSTGNVEIKAAGTLDLRGSVVRVNGGLLR